MALGADASIVILHPDEGRARQVIDLAVAELERLEAIFSLYRPESALCRLNRDGRLADPPFELLNVLTRAAAVSRATDGAFDVTVQPVWMRLRDHFAAHPDAEDAPPLDDVLRLVDWRGLRLDERRIVLDRPGMAVTLNGIAQGYVTDRVADLLRRNGISDVALDLGETRTMGRGANGGPWRIGVPDPTDPERLIARLEASDRAIATSGGYGTLLDAQGRFSHLIDPRSGLTAPSARSVTVMAAEACAADAWSTAFSLMDDDAISDHARTSELAVYLAEGRGGLRRIA